MMNRTESSEFPDQNSRRSRSLDRSPSPSCKLVQSVDSYPDPSNHQKIMNQKPRVQRYLVAVEYIGTRFVGSQKQLEGRTVVGVLEDTGVHALSNVCHVDVERISRRKPSAELPPHEPEVVKRAVNHFLQKHEGDIMVIDVRCVPSDFHARYKAQERMYFYRLLSGQESVSTFEKDRAWQVSEELDLSAMLDACQILMGHHDFSSFRAAGCQANSPMRTLDELNIYEVPSSPFFASYMERRGINSVEVLNDSSDGQEAKKYRSMGAASEQIMLGQKFGKRNEHRCYVITARARSFLYHQVRLLVGVLKCVGTGELTSDDVEKILNAKSAAAAKPMAPACGLYLANVRYDL